MEEDKAEETNILLALDHDISLINLLQQPDYKENPRKIVKKIPKRLLQECNHYCVGSINSNTKLYHDLNMYSEESLTPCQKIFKFFTPFPYQATLLLPIFDAQQTPKQVVMGQDPANFLIKKKLQLQKALTSSLRGQKNTVKEEAVKVTREALSELDASKKNVLRVPRIVATVAACFEADPDPNFTSDYNWYYNGGNLSCIAVDGRKIILSARGEYCDNLCATPLKHTLRNSNGFRAKESQTAVFKTSASGTIFEIACVKHHYSQGLVGVRQRRKCSLFLCTRESKCCLKKLHSCSSKSTPYTSIAVNPSGVPQYCVATALGSIQFWDFIQNKSTTVAKEYRGKYSDWLWSGVRYSQECPNSIFYTQPYSMKIMDQRDPGGIKEIFKLDPAVAYPCEVISASQNSVANYALQYIASNHHLYSIDMRKPGKYLQIWHHLMKSPPQFIKTCQENPFLEIVCLGNTEESKIVSIVNEWPEDNLETFPVSRNQPYCIGSLEKTLTEANLQGLCLKPSRQNRLKLNLTGLCSLTLKRPAVLCATGAGDVFCQRLSLKTAERDLEEEKLLMLSSITLWQEQIKQHELDIQVPTLYARNFQDYSHLQKLVASEGPEDTSLPKSTKLPYASWQLPWSRLFSSKDVYAPKLLSAWGINDADLWEGERAKAYGEDIYLLPPPPQNIDRVNQWLSTDVLAAAPQSQASQFSSQDVAPFSQLSEFTQSTHIGLPALANQSEVGYNESQDATTVITRRQSLSRISLSAKKRRRTDGF